MNMTRKQAEAAMSAIQLARMDAVAEIGRFTRMRSATSAMKDFHIKARREQLDGLVKLLEIIGTAHHLGGY